MALGPTLSGLPGLHIGLTSVSPPIHGREAVSLIRNSLSRTVLPTPPGEALVGASKGIGRKILEGGISTRKHSPLFPG